MLIEYFGWYTNLDLVKTGWALCTTPDSRGVEIRLTVFVAD